MATCRRCGHMLHEGATFCGECGNSVLGSEQDSSGFGYGDSGYDASGYDDSGDGSSSTALSRGNELARADEFDGSGEGSGQADGYGRTPDSESDAGLYSDLEDVPEKRADSGGLEDVLNGNRRPGDPRQSQGGGFSSFRDMYHAVAGVSAIGVQGAMVDKTLASLDKGVDGLSNLFGCDPNSEVILSNGKVGIPRKKSTALILLLLGGWFGAHKFYEQKFALGIAYMLTFGFWLIGPLVDFFILLFGKDSVYYVEKPERSKVPVAPAHRGYTVKKF